MMAFFYCYPLISRDTRRVEIIFWGVKERKKIKTFFRGRIRDESARPILFSNKKEKKLKLKKRLIHSH